MFGEIQTAANCDDNMYDTRIYLSMSDIDLEMYLFTGWSVYLVNEYLLRTYCVSGSLLGAVATSGKGRVSKMTALVRLQLEQADGQ